MKIAMRLAGMVLLAIHTMDNGWKSHISTIQLQIPQQHQCTTSSICTLCRFYRVNRHENIGCHSLGRYLWYRDMWCNCGCDNNLTLETEKVSTLFSLNLSFNAITVYCICYVIITPAILSPKWKEKLAQNNQRSIIRVALIDIYTH